MRMKLKPQWRPWEVRDARNVKSLPREGTSESRANPRSRLCGLQLGLPKPLGLHITIPCDLVCDAPCLSYYMDSNF